MARSKREGQLAPFVDELVLEQAVVQRGETGLTVRRVDEPARDEGREAGLVRAAFGSQPALDHRERALRGRVADLAGQREVHAQAMIAAPVVELGPDPQEGLSGPQLEGGGHRHRHGLVGPAAAPERVADGPLRPPVPWTPRRSGRAPARIP